MDKCHSGWGVPDSRVFAGTDREVGRYCVVRLCWMLCWVGVLVSATCDNKLCHARQYAVPVISPHHRQHRQQQHHSTTTTTKKRKENINVTQFDFNPNRKTRPNHPPTPTTARRGPRPVRVNGESSKPASARTKHSNKGERRKRKAEHAGRKNKSTRSS